jgi:hypothetical protein
LVDTGALGMHTNDHETKRNPNTFIDSEPPMALDKFIEQTGLSPVTIWRFRKKKFLQTVNICGRHYVLRSEVARFNSRAFAGEFSKPCARPSTTSAEHWEGTMPKNIDEKSLAVRKTELENLVTEAVEHHNHVEAARAPR